MKEQPNDKAKHFVSQEPFELPNFITFIRDRKAMARMSETTSKTKSEQWVEESLFGIKPHYVTTISNGDNTVQGRGVTSEVSQEVASVKWDKKQNKK